MYIVNGYRTNNNYSEKHAVLQALLLSKRFIYHWTVKVIRLKVVWPLRLYISIQFSVKFNQILLPQTLSFDLI